MRESGGENGEEASALLLTFPKIARIGRRTERSQLMERPHGLDLRSEAITKDMPIFCCAIGLFRSGMSETDSCCTPVCIALSVFFTLPETLDSEEVEDAS